MDEGPQFGTIMPGIAPTERPGAYAIAMHGNHVLVVATPAGLYLPGGGIDPGESAEATLRREVREETGYEIVTATRLGSARQYVGSGINKIETFFAVSVSGEIGQGEPDHLPHWLPLADAIAAMAEMAQAWALSQRWDTVRLD